MVDAAELHKTLLTYNRHVKAAESSKPVAAIALYQQSFDSLMANLAPATGRQLCALLPFCGNPPGGLRRSYRKPAPAHDLVLIVKKPARYLLGR